MDKNEIMTIQQLKKELGLSKISGFLKGLITLACFMILFFIGSLLAAMFLELFNN